MTRTNMDLSGLPSKHDQADALRPIAVAVPRLIMEADADGPIGAGRHEPGCDRIAWRHGDRDRALDARPGPLGLRLPKLRQG